MPAPAPRSPALADAPRKNLDASGRPCFGAYAGSLERVDWGSLALPRLFRLTHHKRWWYVAVASRELFCAFALVDLGYLSNAFAYAVHLPERKLLVRRSLLGLPGQARIGAQPAVGASGRFGRALRLERPGTWYRLQVDLDGLGGQLELDAGTARALTLICPIPGGAANCTQKLAALPARGSLEIAGRRFGLDGALGGLDYTNGLLARQTHWRWAFGFGAAHDGAVLGFNLVEGFNQSADAAGEDAVWVDGAPRPVRGVRFDFDERAPLSPWRVRSDDGAVDLSFQPIAGHFERHNLVLARSRFVQPAGLFSGTLCGHTIENLPGVTEDQDVRW